MGSTVPAGASHAPRSYVTAFQKLGRCGADADETTLSQDPADHGIEVAVRHKHRSAGIGIRAAKEVGRAHGTSRRPP